MTWTPSRSRHAEVRTVLTSLDLAADWKRDHAETCAYCPDQSCYACQLRLQDAQTYDQLAVQLLHDEQAARDERSQPGLASSPMPPLQPHPADGDGGGPVTTHGRTPDEPGTRRQADGPLVPAQRPGAEDMRELQDPYDLPFPDFSDRWPPRRPEYAVVVDQLRGWQPGGPPSLAELPETGRTREPEPDLEAEP